MKKFDWLINVINVAYQWCVADPPYFVIRPPPFYQLQPQQTVVIPCSAVGEPSPTITWRRVCILQSYTLDSLSIITSIKTFDCSVVSDVRCVFFPLLLVIATIFCWHNFLYIRIAYCIVFLSFVSFYIFLCFWHINRPKRYWLFC